MGTCANYVYPHILVRIRITRRYECVRVLVLRETLQQLAYSSAFVCRLGHRRRLSMAAPSARPRNRDARLAPAKLLPRTRHRARISDPAAHTLRSALALSSRPKCALVGDINTPTGGHSYRGLGSPNIKTSTYTNSITCNKYPMDLCTKKLNARAPLRPFCPAPRRSSQSFSACAVRP